MKTRQLSAPRWDYNRVLFKIRDGENLISCAISGSALQEIDDEGRYARPLELLARFSKNQTSIEHIAREKIRAGQGSISGLVTIWSGDLDGHADDPEGSLT